MKVKTTVSYSHCSLFVEGLEMNCPLCGVLVKSGERHQCQQPEPKIIEAKPKKKLRAGDRGKP